jgi:hypothetical protein
MATTTLTQVANQVQKFWSPIFTKELRAKMLLGSLVNKDYQGQIQKGGDTVYVSQIGAATGALKTVGTDAGSFDTDTLATKRVAVKADKRAVAAFEFEDLVDLQSQIDGTSSEIRDALMYGVMNQINTHLYSLVAPAAAHVVTGVTNFDATELGKVRTKAAQAKWMKEKGWYGLLDPQYYGDLLAAQTMVSGDYGNEKPLVGGQLVERKMGFNILEDDSRAADKALFFHPDFMHLVMQTTPTFKVSDLHSNKKFGYLISVDVIFGAALGIDGDKKHITVDASV